jgi:hypothetical protein
MPIRLNHSLAVLYGVIDCPTPPDTRQSTEGEARMTSAAAGGRWKTIDVGRVNRVAGSSDLTGAGPGSGWRSP